MSLKTIVQDAAKRIGLVPPDLVIGNSDETAVRLGALANQEGIELMRRHDWQALLEEHSFQTAAGRIQAAGIPASLDRIVRDTAWNRTARQKLTGPVSPQEWQELMLEGGATSRPTFRIRGGNLLLAPDAVAGQTVAFEYVDNRWAKSSTGDRKASFTDDNDNPVLDVEAITLGIVWRYKQAQGLDYAEAHRSYELAVANLISHDGGRRILIAPSRGSRGLSTVQTWGA